MEAKERLDCINRLLEDAYGQRTRISSLLSDYLNAEQLSRLKAEKMDDFLRLFVLGIQIRLISVGDGMRKYAILAARYGLEDAATRTLSSIGDAEGVSRERIRQLKDKALGCLRPNARYDAIKQIACLAAREALRLEALPRRLTEDPVPAGEDARTNPKMRAYASNSGMPWTADLDERLKSRFHEGASVAELAEEMGRTKGGIRSRLVKHGLMEGQEQTV